MIFFLQRILKRSMKNPSKMLVKFFYTVDHNSERGYF